jgi:heterodisulfide reductase subunit B
VNYCDLATREVSSILGIELVDLKDAGCCGHFLRSIDSKSPKLLSARILSLAEKQKLDLMVLCNSCYAHLKETSDIQSENSTILNSIKKDLKAEGLEYTGKTRIKDILEVFYEDYGIQNIKQKVKRNLEGLKVAVHYGCHLLRPSRITRFDNAEDPHILDELVEITGAKSIYWPLKLWCCGFPTFSTDRKMGLTLTMKKLIDAKESGANCIVTTCPSCQISFDALQQAVSRMYGEKITMPVLYYPQLLGLALGLSRDDLGLNFNRISIDAIPKLLGK